jgi:hypothetical protein
MYERKDVEEALHIGRGVGKLWRLIIDQDGESLKV